jgi:hypothetical protein
MMLYVSHISTSIPPSTGGSREPDGRRQIHFYDYTYYNCLVKLSGTLGPTLLFSDKVVGKTPPARPEPSKSALCIASHLSSARLQNYFGIQRLRYDYRPLTPTWTANQVAEFSVIPPASTKFYPTAQQDRSAPVMEVNNVLEPLAAEEYQLVVGEGTIAVTVKTTCS